MDPHLPYRLSAAAVPVNIAARIALSLDNALAYQQISQLKDRLTRENRLLTEEISNYENFDEIIGQSVLMTEVLEQVRMVADTDSSVLIRGESGTGKELVACGDSVAWAGATPAARLGLKRTTSLSRMQRMGFLVKTLDEL